MLVIELSYNRSSLCSHRLHPQQEQVWIHPLDEFHHKLSGCQTRIQIKHKVTKYLQLNHLQHPQMEETHTPL